MSRTVSFIFLVLIVQTSATFKICLKNVIKNQSEVLSTKCEIQFLEYVDNLSTDPNSWALQMLDATSELKSGMIPLNIGHLGNFDECISIRTNQSKTGTIVGKYCLGFINRDTFYKRAKVTIGLEEVKSSPSSRAFGPTWAACVPGGCSGNDTTTIINSFFAKCIQVPKNVNFDDLFCQTFDDVSPRLTTAAIVAIVVLAMLLSFLLITTLIDVYYSKRNKECPYTIITAFSAFTNGKTIFKLRKSELSCLNGLKLFSMVWIVLGHQYSITITGTLDNTKDTISWANSWHSMFIVSGLMAVDTFFLTTGVLLSYGFLKSRQQNIKINLFKYYLHRYLRLTPPMAVAILVNGTLLKYLGSGPRWPLVNKYFQQNCVNYWWTALLYVQNYVNVDKMCLGQSWYLNVDMQLYIISPAIFYLFWKWPTWAINLIVLVVLGIAGVDFYVGWINELPAIVSNFYENDNNFNNKYYLLTHTRAAPWLIGVILGYIILKIKTGTLKFRPRKFINISIWILCLGTLLTCTLGGFGTLRGQHYDKWGNALHIALVRHAWSIAIAWIILACNTNNGGPINWILSLDVYQLLYLMIYSKKLPQHFSDFNMIYQFWGTWWFSTLLSVPIVFVAEAPINLLEKLVFDDVPWKKTVHVENTEGIVNLGFRE